MLYKKNVIIISRDVIYLFNFVDVLNLEDLDGDDDESDGNDFIGKEDGRDGNIATQGDIFQNIDINFNL